MRKSGKGYERGAELKSYARSQLGGIIQKFRHVL